MKTLMPKVEQRQIGRVQVFDLYGTLTGEQSVEVIDKIDHVIQKKKLKRVILNLQKVQELDELIVRRLIASLIRPQKSLVFCTNDRFTQFFKGTYLPKNIKLCISEAEIADSVGSFLFEKDKDTGVPKELGLLHDKYGLERRRSKRIRVAIPIEIEFETADGKKVHSKAIATNISQGGLFAEYLDLDSSLQVSQMSDLESNKVTILVPANESFPEEVKIQGCIKRIELSKRQVGLGIQFLDSKQV